MRLVKIDATLFEIYREDQEVLTKTKRPYVLVLRLAYKDDTYDFAVPLRSNISASAPKDQYFPLPADRRPDHSVDMDCIISKCFQ